MSDTKPFKILPDGRMISTRVLKPGEHFELYPDLPPCTCPPRPSSLLPSTLFSGSNTPAFRVSPSPLGGVGVFANRDINIGELLLQEQPLFTATCVCCPPGKKAVESLDRKAAAIFWALADSHNSKPTMKGIYDTNAFEIGSPAHAGGKPLCGVFEFASRFNHDCSPNCICYEASDGTGMTIVANQDVQKDTELTIPYSSLLGPRAERQANFRNVFNMTCRCPTCTAPPERQKLSDERRTLISMAFSDNMQRALAYDPLTVYQFTKRCLRILDRELPNDHYNKFQIYQISYHAARALKDGPKRQRQAALAHASFRFTWAGGDSVEGLCLGDSDHLKDCPQGQSENTSKTPDLCDFCGKVSAVRCVDCGIAEYCSQVCMRKHRKVHDAPCKFLVATKR